MRKTIGMEYLKLEHRDRVALLTLNDPERRNVVSNELNEEFQVPDKLKELYNGQNTKNSIY